MTLFFHCIYCNVAVGQVYTVIEYFDRWEVICHFMFMHTKFFTLLQHTAKFESLAWHTKKLSDMCFSICDKARTKDKRKMYIFDENGPPKTAKSIDVNDELFFEVKPSRKTKIVIWSVYYCSANFWRPITWRRFFFDATRLKIQKNTTTIEFSDMWRHNFTLCVIVSNLYYYRLTEDSFGQFSQNQITRQILSMVVATNARRQLMYLVLDKRTKTEEKNSPTKEKEIKLSTQKRTYERSMSIKVNVG